MKPESSSCLLLPEEGVVLLKFNGPLVSFNMAMLGLRPFKLTADDCSPSGNIYQESSSRSFRLEDLKSGTFTVVYLAFSLLSVVTLSSKDPFLRDSGVSMVFETGGSNVHLPIMPLQLKTERKKREISLFLYKDMHRRGEGGRK